jgi:LPXTG-motif cell wall-anchored protein
MANEIDKPKEIGKYCLDLSKLLIGGAILTTAIKQDLPPTTIFLFSGIIVVALIVFGFILLFRKRKKE